MRKYLVTLSCTLFITSMFAIAPNKKFGNPTKEEFDMTIYEPDTTASAVVLFEKGDAIFSYDPFDGSKIDYIYTKRVKVLKDNGVSGADIVIPYYNGYIESKIDVSAYAYNIIDGKIDTIKMSDDLVFKERINSNLMLAKFSIPSVKVGSIFEYKYKLKSSTFYSIQAWYAQGDYPIAYSELALNAQSNIEFKIKTYGYLDIDITQVPTLDSILANSPETKAVCIKQNQSSFLFIAKDVPKIKDVEYLWCNTDHIIKAKINVATVSSDQSSLPDTLTWEEIDKTLWSKNYFNNKFIKNNPFKKDVRNLKLDTIKKKEDKVAKIFTLLKSKIKWNGDYRFNMDFVRTYVKSGLASNAALNIILINMLRDEGIECFPVVLRTKDIGIYPFENPSINDFNTFVVGFLGSGGKINYVDGSIENAYINILPPLMHVDKARIISKDYSGEKWVDLSNISRNLEYTRIFASIDTTGIIKGKTITNYTGQFSSIYKKTFKQAKDSLEFVSAAEKGQEYKIISLQHDDVNKFSSTHNVEIEFEKEAMVNDSLIYFNPIIFNDSEINKFEEEERKLPIEFANTQEIAFTLNITLPKGYEIEELPASLDLKLGDNDGSYTYSIERFDGGINVFYKFGLKKISFEPDRYNDLRTFWNKMADKNNEMVVLKRVN